MDFHKEEKDEEEKTKENDKSVSTSVPRKEKVIYLFLEILASNSFIILGDFYQIEWGETVLMMNSALLKSWCELIPCCAN